MRTRLKAYRGIHEFRKHTANEETIVFSDKMTRNGILNSDADQRKNKRKKTLVKYYFLDFFFDFFFVIFEIRFLTHTGNFLDFFSTVESSFRFFHLF